MSAGLHLSLCNECDEVYIGDAEFAERTNTCSVTRLGDAAHEWRIQGASAPKHVSSQDVPMHVFTVAVHGEPLAELTFAVRVLAVACEPRAWMVAALLGVHNAATELLPMPTMLELRAWRVDELNNEVRGDVAAPVLTLSVVSVQKQTLFVELQSATGIRLVKKGDSVTLPPPDPARCASSCRLFCRVVHGWRALSLPVESKGYARVCAALTNGARCPSCPYTLSLIHI